jgi:hypothetical protein
LTDANQRRLMAAAMQLRSRPDAAWHVASMVLEATRTRLRQVA